jgi:hypothetical protein
MAASACFCAVTPLNAYPLRLSVVTINETSDCATETVRLWATYRRKRDARVLVRTRQIADGSSASGYDVNLESFEPCAQEQHRLPINPQGMIDRTKKGVQRREIRYANHLRREWCRRDRSRTQARHREPQVRKQTRPGLCQRPEFEAGSDHLPYLASSRNSASRAASSLYSCRD